MSGLTKNNIMESTIKIGNSSRGIHSVPIIKIVQPVSLIKPDPHMDIEDVRDQLISEFLHTPVMANPNSFFMVTGRWLVPFENSKSQITTISAIEEGQLFHTMKHAMFERFISYDNLVEINEFKSRITTIKEGIHGPVPFGYDVYLQITNFFDFIHTLPYNGDPVNTPIDVRK